MRSETDNANDDQGKYLYFLDAVGGPGTPLSVLGTRVTAPPRSPFAYVVFLFSTRIASLQNNTHLTRTVRRCARRLIEMSLTAQRLDEESTRLRRTAENAFDFEFMAHEAVSCLGRPKDIVSATRPGIGLDAHETDEVRYGLLRTWAVMRQLCPKGIEKTAFDLETQVFQPLNIVDQVFGVCRKVVDAEQVSFRRTTELAEDLVVSGRRLVFECVLRNLILNAAQQLEEYCDGRGSIEVSLEIRHESDGGTSLVVRVSDDGPGIHGKYWEAVFEPGVTTRREGTGLGLTVSRRLITSATGTLELFESVLYTGTTFRITMPVHLQT